MNYSVVIYILGWIMEIEAAFLTLPGIVSAIYGERGGFAFLWVALGSAVAGSIIILRKPKNMRFYLREGFVTVALSWILMSVIGCLPFVINGDIPHFALYAPAEGIRHAFFQVASIITTTGFASADFNLWPETSKTILVILMFIGACAGSTGGGIKVSRFIIACKSFIKEIISYLHPRSVKKIKIEGKPLEHETLRATNVYFMTYMVIFAVSVLLVLIENKDLVTNFAAVAATFNNIGPGLSLVGPMANFGHFTDFTKYILMFDMLAGRLEIFPMMLLFCPAVWKRRRA